MLQIHILDVGHGDSAVIEFPDGRSFAVIDSNRCPGANRGFGGPHNPKEPKALSFLRSRFAKLPPSTCCLEFVCLTHPHDDHYSGLAELLREVHRLGVPIKEFWDTGISPEMALNMAECRKGPEGQVTHRARVFPEQWEPVRELVDLVELTLNMPARFPCLHQMISVSRPTPPYWEGHGVKVHVLAPSATHAAGYVAGQTIQGAGPRRAFARTTGASASENTLSAGLLIEYGDCKFILGGDLTNRAWQTIVDEDPRFDVRCNGLKVSHHGSREGNFPRGKPLWSRLTLESHQLTACISGGYRPGNPHQETIDELVTAGARVFVTGPGELKAMRPYIPKKANADVRDRLSVEGLQEIVGTCGPGCGDLLVQCNANGDIYITTEHPQPALTTVRVVGKRRRSRPS